MDFADDRPDRGEPGEGGSDPPARRPAMTVEEAARRQAAYAAKRRAWAERLGRVAK